MRGTTINKSQGRKNPALGTEKIGKLIWLYSIPAIISGLVSAAYNIVDQIFIGQGIGELGMAATNVAFPLVTISTALALLFGVGGASNFNLSMGRGNSEEASNIGIPFLVFSTGAANLIRADGSPTFSMMVMLSGAVFNLIFDPIFLFVFHMGIEGIALATLLGQVLSSIIAFYYLLRRFKTVAIRREQLRIQPDITRLICALGAAACFNQLAMTVVQIVKSNTLRHYGALSVYGSEIPLAAVGAVSKVLVVFMAVILGIAQGCLPSTESRGLCGQAQSQMERPLFWQLSLL